MTKVVTFYLGPAPAGAALASRTLVVRRMMKAGDDSLPAATHNADAGPTAEFVDVTLADNQIYQATLADVKTSGETAVVDVLNFHTGSLQFPGPRSADRLQIYAMQDLSSSSASSASSISTSSSTSSASSASSSSTSSASSISTSSVSSSSVSTSSSLSASASSASTSSSSSSSSSVSSSSVSSSSKSSGSSGLN